MVIHRLQSLYSMASSSAHDFFFQEANTLYFVHSLISRAWRHLGVTHVPLVIQALLAMCWLKKWMLISIECVFLDFWDARGLGLLFVVCACAVGLRGNGLPGMRGTWGDNWRSAHVPTIPFTWLRRANALGPTAHASNYQALLSLKLCKECGFNSCVRVFIIPWGHVNNHDHIWAFVTSIWSHGRNARFWLVEKIFAALWLVTDPCSPYDYLLSKRIMLELLHLSLVFSIGSWTCGTLYHCLFVRQQLLLVLRKEWGSF